MAGTNYESQRSKQNEAILGLLHDGRLDGQVIVILMLGASGAGKTNLLKVLTGQDLPVGHGQQSGQKLVLFIDTPGFGHPDLPITKVKKAIHDLLGYFTRRLGGIHGIFYLHDIRSVRKTQGMQESFGFLEELTRPNCPPITFITTGWDIIPQKERARSVQRKNDLAREWGEKFADPQLFEFGVSWEDDPPEEIRSARVQLADLIITRYGNTQVRSLEMPFWETKLGVFLSSIQFQITISEEPAIYYVEF